MPDTRNLSLRHRTLLDLLNNRNSTDPVLAEGTNAGTFKTTAATTFTINGQWFAKAATDNIAFATAGAAFTTQPDLSTAYYLFLIDSAGAITVLQGVPSTTAASKDNVGIGRPGQIPYNTVADRAVLGAMKIVLSGGTFLPGTTDLSAAGVTDTYVGMSHIGISTF